MSFIHTRAGLAVDTSKDVWQIGEGYRLDFRKLFARRSAIEREWPLLDAVVAYMERSVVERAPGTVSGNFDALAEALLSDAVGSFGEPGAGFLMSVYRNCRKRMAHDTAKARMAICRRWYVFSSDAGLEGFDPDTAIAMQALSIGRTHRGVAVRRLDPTEGPLTKTEMASLEAALWSAFDHKSLPIADVAAGLIFLLLGPNPANVHWLNETDLAREVDADGHRILKMPRIKKGHAKRRAGFKERPLDRDFAAVLDSLIAANATLHPPQPGDDPSERPMFPAPLAKSCGKPARVATTKLWEKIERLPGRLGVGMADGGELRLNPRRLRYSFAQRMVIERKVTPDVLANLLDHSSLSDVLVYYDPRLDLVAALDKALERPMRRLANIALRRAAAPRIVDCGAIEAELSRAPYACLACRRFRPVAAGAVARTAVNLARRRSESEGQVGRARTERQRAVIANIKSLTLRAELALEALQTKGRI